MSSSDSAGAANGELVLKIEEYDIDGGQSSSFQSSTTALNQCLGSVNHLANAAVNFNNNITVNCGGKSSNLNNNTNSLSPKLEPFSCPLAPVPSSSPDRMPIPILAEMQSTAGTTPAQHPMSPSLPPPPPQQQQQQTLPSSNGSPGNNENLLNTRRMTSILGGYGLVPPGILGPLDHYRLQLYSYAMNVERLRGCGGPQQYPPGPLYGSGYPGSTGGPVGNVQYAPTRFALSMGLFPNRMFQPEEPKPQHSYIGLIAMAILSSPESKLVLSDIYQYILDNYPYFRSRGPGWRNSIRHNLSLNDCFIKAGRSANGKGHYWAVHPANLDDFRKGDFRRRKAQRKVRKHMGLAVDDEGTDSPSPPPLAITPPPIAPPPHSGVLLVGNNPYVGTHHSNHQHYSNPLSSVILSGGGGANETSTTTTAAGVIANLYSQTRKRQFDVASLLAPDDTPDHNHHHHHHHHHHNHHPHHQQQSSYKGHLSLTSKQRIALTEDEDIDVVASDAEDDQDQQVLHHVENEQPFNHNQSRSSSNSHNQSGGSDETINSSPFNSTHEFNNRHLYQSSNSPINQSDPSSDIQSCNNNQNTISTNWQGLMQQWPNEFGTAAAAAAAAAMDPRIFGRYYSQYMAAAAARRVAGVFPAAAAAAAAAAVIGQHQNSSSTKLQSNVAQQHASAASAASLQHKQQQHQQQSYEC